MARWRVPSAWLGWWEADDGKSVFLEGGAEHVHVTVAPSAGARPYRTARLLSLRRKRVRRLSATTDTDARGVPFIEVEAGTPGLGPTYRLHPLTNEPPGRRLIADLDLPAAQILLVPAVHIGLYDDFEDDLGVPWAWPLLPFGRIDIRPPA